jgi:predicted nuclease with TOPRIM domain
MYPPEDELNKLDKLVRQLSRNATHRKIVNIAQEHGWKIKPAGREKVKAYRDNYRSVSIPGHNNGADIPYGTARHVIKALLEPSFEVAALKAQIKNLQNDFDIQKTRADKAENQITELRCNHNKLKTDNERLEDDREAAWELAQETENTNHRLRKELQKYKYWIESLKQHIANLMQQRAEQEVEMLEIANKVEKKERRIQDSAEMLTQFSRRLPPQRRQELKQIIGYLLTE